MGMVSGWIPVETGDESTHDLQSSDSYNTYSTNGRGLADRQKMYGNYLLHLNDS